MSHPDEEPSNQTDTGTTVAPGLEKNAADPTITKFESDFPVGRERPVAGSTVHATLTITDIQPGCVLFITGEHPGITSQRISLDPYIGQGTVPCEIKVPEQAHGLSRIDFTVVDNTGTTVSEYPTLLEWIQQ